MTHLSNFNQPVKAAIIGASGGIGSAFVQHLCHDENVENIYALSRSQKTFAHEKVQSLPIDLTDETSIKKAAEQIDEELDLIVVSAGLLHQNDLQPEKALKDLSPENFERIFKINTFGPAMVAKHFLPLIPKEKPSVFAALSARVGSISDNHIGGWYAYRMSKAALNMFIRGASIEVARKYKHARIIGLHPGTVDTNLSEPFQGHVKEDKLFSPDYSTEQLLKVINETTPKDSGKIFAYNGEVIPY